MIWEVSQESLWTLSLRLSQFHGHGSWLVCEVALNQQISWLNIMLLNYHGPRGGVWSLAIVNFTQDDQESCVI
jgi:hypothetical protein